MLHPVTCRALALAACGWLLAGDASALGLAAERDPALRLRSELQLQPASDPQARQAAAAPWTALQRGPEDILRDGQRVQSLEREIGALRAQVEQARGDRNLAALLALAVLALLAALAAWTWWRWRRAQRLEDVERWFDTREPALARFPVGAPVGAAGATGALAGPDTEPDGGTVRTVGVRELIDVHDKADFFLALGQHEQAIAVLEAHVHDQAETSALSWMDLLELHHKRGKRSDFERLRAEFRQRFAVQLPDFDHFDQPTSSLENHGRALSRIVALWPSPRVLAVIEESIFRKPGLPGAEPFSLEAYRELVLLYRIAQEVASAPDSLAAPLDYRPTDFPATSLQPLNLGDLPERSSRRPAPEPEAIVVMGRTSHEADEDEATEPPVDRNRLLIPPASPRIGLDIDLDAPAADDTESRPRDLPALDVDTGDFDERSAEDPAHKSR